MTKPVSLTAHRNTRDRRRRHQSSEDFLRWARDMAREKRMTGYVIIAWDDNECTKTVYDSGKIPARVVPEFVKQKLMQAINDEAAK